MASSPTNPAELALALNEEERQLLLRLLEQGLGDTRVEVHHTRTPGFREQVLREEDLLRGLIEKVRGLRP